SAGQWRQCAFENEEDWPALAIQFERMKFLCVRSEGTSVLWKFAGLHCAEDGQSASDIAFKQLAARASAGFGPVPLGTCWGFVGMPWVEGRRLTLTDAADASVLTRVGNYIVHAKGPELSWEEQGAAIARLAEML